MEGRGWGAQAVLVAWASRAGLSLAWGALSPRATIYNARARQNVT